MGEPNFFGLVVGWTFLGIADIRSWHLVPQGAMVPQGAPEKKGEMGMAVLI